MWNCSADTCITNASLPTCVVPFGPPPSHPCTMLQSGLEQDRREWPASGLRACNELETFGHKKLLVFNIFETPSSVMLQRDPCQFF